jgi:hypothetical protein
MIRFPNQHFSAATLCNLASISPGALNRRIADIYLKADFPLAKGPPAKDPPAKGPPAKGPAEEFPQPAPERLAALAGVYVARDDGDRILRLRLEDGKLWGGDLTGKGRELTAIRTNSFRFAGIRGGARYDGRRKWEATSVSATRRGTDNALAVRTRIPN